MFGVFGFIGTLTVLNVNKTKAEADKMLDYIRGVASESSILLTKSKNDSDKAVEQGDKTIRELTAIVQKANYMTEEAKQSVQQWRSSKQAYVSSPTISTPTLSPSASRSDFVHMLERKLPGPFSTSPLSARKEMSSTKVAAAALLDEFRVDESKRG